MCLVPLDTVSLCNPPVFLINALEGECAISANAQGNANVGRALLIEAIPELSGAAQVRRFASAQRDPPTEDETDDSAEDGASDDYSDSDSPPARRQTLALPSPPGGWSLSSLQAAAAAGANRGALAPARGSSAWWPFSGVDPTPAACQADECGGPWPSAVATAVTLSASVVVFMPQEGKGRGGGSGARRRARAHQPSPAPAPPASLFSEAPKPLEAAKPAAALAPAPARTVAGWSKEGARAVGLGPDARRGIERAAGLDIAAAMLAAALCVLAALEMAMVRCLTLWGACGACNCL